ncbi:MAG: hypothetical protein ABIR79_25400 [Candidatus Binatia bacterium]
MRRPKGTLALLVMTLLATASLQGCVGTTMTGEPAGRRFCNVSSAGCMALKMQQTKTGTIAGQQGRCCG